MDLKFYYSNNKWKPSPVIDRRSLIHLRQKIFTFIRLDHSFFTLRKSCEMFKKPSQISTIKLSKINSEFDW